MEASDTGSQVSHSAGVCSSHRDTIQKRVKQVKMRSGLILVVLLWAGFPRAHLPNQIH